MLMKERSKLKPELKLESPFDLRTMNTNIIIEKLEEDIKLREARLADRIKFKTNLINQ